ncbi:MAG: glucose dehydrogenase [Blastocatellia bacterium]|jgi:choline dehydrogenase-like flavoprotein|nr:glucose dehydrogenase [Blastocatellia bacterium]
MSKGTSPQYDVVIVGAGVSGNLIALQLGLAGKKVLILEAGLAVPDNREEYMNNFYLALAKTPEAPYPALAGRTGSKENPAGALPDPATLPTPRATVLGLGGKPDVSYLIQAQSDASANPDKKDPQNPPTDDKGNVRGLQFPSTFERNGGGTAWHWLGTSLRELENDIRLNTKYGHGVDWPITYKELQPLWALAEKEIGVSASVAQQEPLEVVGLQYPPGYQYPMGPIPTSMVDQAISQGISGLQVPGTLPDTPGGSDPTMYDVFVTPTPAGRNSEPYDDRRVCAGNTNCIPICPIQAKWDPTVTLGKALDTGNVTMSYQSVAYNVAADGKTATRIDYYQWSRDAQGNLQKVSKSVTGKLYVLACHAIENVKLLLLSNNWKGIANHSDQVGRNLMDHPLYLTWALAPQPMWGYRGPLATAGIESLRDGEFRKYRSSFRMEIGNEGWNFATGDPYTTTLDFITGTNGANTNTGGPNGTPQRLGGTALAMKLNNLFTSQFRIACMFDQSPLQENRVTLDLDANGKPNHTDGLGIPRPKVEYGLDPYTMEGFRMAAHVCSTIYQQMGATEFTKNGVGGTGDFTYRGQNYHYYGAGHVVGTHRMGDNPDTSVVDASQRSHDIRNLWIVGSGSFPTVATANPTLTLMALAFKSAKSILASLGS